MTLVIWNRHLKHILGRIPLLKRRILLLKHVGRIQLLKHLDRIPLLKHLGRIPLLKHLGRIPLLKHLGRIPLTGPRRIPNSRIIKRHTRKTLARDPRT